MESLVVYYTRTGNTRFVAEKIADCLDADIEEIVDKTNREGWFGFLRSAVEAMVGGETDIEETECSPDNYDLIILGSPVWARKITPAVRTYLKKHDFPGKKVAFFNTNDSDESQNTFQTMKNLTNNPNPVDCLVASEVSKNREKVEEKVENWCDKLSSELS